MDSRAAKEAIRRRVWDELQARGLAAFPLPPHGRIPNFRGAERAASRILSTPEWGKAEVVKVNPDAPQRSVRLAALEQGKRLLMPTPRLRRGFILLDPQLLPRRLHPEASTIRGAFRYGRLVERAAELERLVRRVDFIVEGSVAVNPWGERLGKGEGYGELEYAILRELGLIDPDVPIATTVHDVQVLGERLPQDPWDVPIDIIATPTRLIRVQDRPGRPPGILWGLLPKGKLEEIPILRELAAKQGRT